MRPVLLQPFAPTYNNTKMQLIAKVSEQDIVAVGSDVHVSTAQRIQYPTTAIERFLLLATIVLLPIEDDMPTVAGCSLLFIMFALLAGHLFLNHLRAAGRTWLHPVFLSGYALFAAGVLIESGHPYSNYSDLVRFGLMIAGAVVVASVCRDKQAMQASIYGYMIGSTWLSAFLFRSMYHGLAIAVATNYDEASNIRETISDTMTMEANLNNLALLTAQGAVVALALALTARSFLQRCVFLGVSVFCLVGTFLPMSRGGILIAAGSCAAVLLSYRAKRARVFVIGLVLGAAVLMWVPHVVFSRLDVSSGDREKTYTTTIEQLPKYIAIGIGSGNFWESWGVEHGFTAYSGKALGPHDIFIAIMIYWGLPGFFALLALIWQAYRCVPKGCGNDPLALCLPGLGISLILMMLFSHGFYDKWYSLGLGLLVAARFWIWPSGIVKPTFPTKRYRYRPIFRKRVVTEGI
jgi:hypothetical protein